MQFFFKYLMADSIVDDVIVPLKGLLTQVLFFFSFLFIIFLTIPFGVQSLRVNSWDNLRQTSKLFKHLGQKQQKDNVKQTQKMSVY